MTFQRNQSKTDPPVSESEQSVQKFSRMNIDDQIFTVVHVCSVENRSQKIILTIYLSKLITTR